jgi:hypothetical protein
LLPATKARWFRLKLKFLTEHRMQMPTRDLAGWEASRVLWELDRIADADRDWVHADRSMPVGSARLTEPANGARATR